MVLKWTDHWIGMRGTQGQGIWDDFVTARDTLFALSLLLL